MPSKPARPSPRQLWSPCSRQRHARGPCPPARGNPATAPRAGGAGPGRPSAPANDLSPGSWGGPPGRPRIYWRPVAAAGLFTLAFVVGLVAWSGGRRPAARAQSDAPLRTVPAARVLVSQAQGVPGGGPTGRRGIIDHAQRAWY